jgi:long-chain acyl-CoA synthetase
MPNSVAALLTAAAEDAPDGLAVTEAAGRAVTWRQLDDEVSRVSTGLGAAGLVAGQRVVIAVGNRIEFVTSYLGTLRAQLVAVPVNPRSTTAELQRVLEDSGARLLVASPEAVDAARAAVDALGGDGPRIVPVDTATRPGEQSYDELAASSGPALPALQDDEALAALLYTSGTTALPRAAMLSHRALVANVAQVAEVEPPMITAEDVVLGVLPLFHVYGLNGVLGSVIHARAKLVLAEGFDPAGTLDLVEDEAVSVVPVAPPVFGHWLPAEDLAERLGPVRLLLSGSAPLSPQVIEEFVALTGKPVHQGYGLTEAAPVVTSTLCSKEPSPGSVGAPLPGIELRAVDEDGAPVASDDPGEIQVRGDNLFSGYWPDAADGPAEDGWWSTGDIGYVDDAGDLVLVDRAKEIVIVSGFNVYPAEVEEVVREVPGVRQVAVVGSDDERTGEAVVAYVVPAGDAAAADLRESVRARCAERLAGFKQPTVIHLVDELPLTITGKVQKGRLRSVARRQALDLLEGGAAE